MKFETLLDNIKSHATSHLSYRNIDNEVTKKTFSEFLADVESLQQKLRSIGFRAGDIIGIQAKNSYEWVVLDIATLDLGIVLQVYSEDMAVDISQLKAFVSDRNIPGSFGLDLEWRPADSNNKKTSEGYLQIADKDVLSRAYSSGTTGTPKGLTISRLGVEHLINTIHASYQISEKDTHIIFLPFSNFQQRMSVYGCLSAGVSFFISNLATAIQDIKKFGPSFIICPPIFYEMFLRVHVPPGMEAEARNLMLTGLGGNIRIMITGMAPIKGSVLNHYIALELPLYEVYGTTEIGMIALNTPGANLYGSVGIPIEKNSIAFGSDNEIILNNSCSLSTKYFDFGNGEEQELLATSAGLLTGDLGYISDGYLFLTGRKKDVLITSGGYKFNPFEHEKIMLEIPQVLGCIVLTDHEEDVSAIVVLPKEKAGGMVDAVKEKVKAINQNAVLQKHITKIYVTHNRFEETPGFMTRNMKLNRSAIRDGFLASFAAKDVNSDTNIYWKM